MIQTQRFIGAEAGFAHARRRWQKYRNHFEQLGMDGLPGSTPPEEALNFQFLINELSDELEQHIEVTWARICGSFVDLSGNPLERERECELQVVPDIFSMIAEISSDHLTGKPVLKISTGAVLLMDIVSTAFNIGFRTNSKMLRMNPSHFSDDIMNFVGNPIYLIYFCHYISTGNEDEKNRWCYSCEYSLEWILRHELGHYLLGHVEYLAKVSNSPSFSERAVTEQFSAEDIVYGSGLPLVRYSAELLADSYAMVSMFLDCLRGYEFEDSALNRGNRCNIINHSIAMTGVSMIVPLMILQMPEITDWRNRGKHESGTHPKVISRLVGAFSALAYILDPPHDVRNDPNGFNVRGTIDDVYEDTPWHFSTHLSLYSCMEVTLRSLAANGLLGNDTKEEYDAGVRELNLRAFSSVILGRFAASFPDTEQPERSDAESIVGSSYDEWSKIFQINGAKLCGFFISHFDRSILSEGRINDPTYFILNEWLGKAQLSNMGVDEFYGHSIIKEKKRAEALFSLIERHDQRVST